MEQDIYHAAYQRRSGAKTGKTILRYLEKLLAALSYSGIDATAGIGSFCFDLRLPQLSKRSKLPT